MFCGFNICYVGEARCFVGLIFLFVLWIVLVVLYLIQVVLYLYYCWSVDDIRCYVVNRDALSGLDFIRLITRVLWIGLSFHEGNFYFNGTFCFLLSFFCSENDLLFWQLDLVLDKTCWSVDVTSFSLVRTCCIVHGIRCESKLDLLFYGKYLFSKLGFLFK